ncbi:DUF3060 domain-containing protein [Pseudorhodoplanes sp.]|uniref:DUF3060 domain-containing protein n=1 Tax=Pseudorhodoplanes sp. TaxID=1934341 RepID=UPI003D1207C0
MARIALPLLAAVTLTACGGDNPDRTYSGVAVATHDCGKEKKVAVDGTGGSFTLNGTCDSVTVNGGDNRLAVEASKAVTINGARNVIDVGAADRIAVRGYGNTVTWRKGASGSAPHTVTATGDRNAITQAQ